MALSQSLWVGQQIAEDRSLCISVTLGRSTCKTSTWLSDGPSSGMLSHASQEGSQLTKVKVVIGAKFRERDFDDRYT